MRVLWKRSTQNGDMGKTVLIVEICNEKILINIDFSIKMCVAIYSDSKKSMH